MKKDRQYYQKIGNDNVAFLAQHIEEDKVVEDLKILRAVMRRAASIIMVTQATDNRLQYQAAQILLAPDLPDAWGRGDESKIQAAVAYINEIIINEEKLAEEEVQSNNDELFKSSLTESHKEVKQSAVANEQKAALSESAAGNSSTVAERIATRIRELKASKQQSLESKPEKAAVPAESQVADKDAKSKGNSSAIAERIVTRIRELKASKQQSLESKPEKAAVPAESQTANMDANTSVTVSEQQVAPEALPRRIAELQLAEQSKPKDSAARLQALKDRMNKKADVDLINAIEAIQKRMAEPQVVEAKAAAEPIRGESLVVGSREEGAAVQAEPQAANKGDAAANSSIDRATVKEAATQSTAPQSGLGTPERPVLGKESGSKAVSRTLEWTKQRPTTIDDYVKGSVDSLKKNLDTLEKLLEDKDVGQILNCKANPKYSNGQFLQRLLRDNAFKGSSIKERATKIFEAIDTKMRDAEEKPQTLRK